MYICAIPGPIRCSSTRQSSLTDEYDRGKSSQMDAHAVMSTQITHKA